MNDTLKAAGKALSPILQPFHQAQGKQLTAVLRRDTDEGEEMILAFGMDGLFFACDEDLDKLTLRFEELSDIEDVEDLTTDAAWNRFLGKEFFWGWLTINQQGYNDGALLSFDGVVPEIGLNVVASEFEVLEIRQRAR
jgi:hypothetical protein